MRIDRPSGDERGFTTLMALAMIAIMIALISANSAALFQLKREVRLLERKHETRWKKLNQEALEKAQNNGAEVKIN